MIFKGLVIVAVALAMLVQYRLSSQGILDLPISNPLPPLPDFPSGSVIKNMTGKVQVIGQGELVGPESLVVGRHLQQEYMFAALGDGRIARLQHTTDSTSGAEVSWKFITRTGPSTGGDCPFDPADRAHREPRCGRPLGIRIVKRSTVDPNFDIDDSSQEDKEDEDVLVVADAYQGLLMVSNIYATTPGATRVTTLARRAATDDLSYRFQLLNGLVQAPDGSLYLSETSRHFQRRRIFHAALEGRPTGRLLRYSKAEGKVTVIADHLFMPNGVALSHDGSKIILVAGVQVHQFDIQQQRLSQNDFITLLPGTGDNIDAMTYTPSGIAKKCYWLGLGSKYAKPFSLLQLLSDKPILKTILMALVPYHVLINFIPKLSALAVYDEFGKLMEIYRDDSKVAPWVSEGESLGGYLYLGSWFNPYLARVQLDELSPS